MDEFKQILNDLNLAIKEAENILNSANNIRNLVGPALENHKEVKNGFIYMENFMNNFIDATKMMRDKLKSELN